MNNLDIFTQAIVVFATQYLFIYFRTINIEAQIKRNRMKLFLSGTVVHITYLVSMAIGVNAVLNGNILLIVCSLIGGLLGADCAFMKHTKQS